MPKVDIFIKNGLIVTINEKMEIIENGAIAIKNNRILKIGKTELLEEEYTSDKIFDASSNIVMPGLINAHTHIPMTYFRGLADDLPLDEWLQNYIWPAEAKFLSEDFVYDAALHGAAEMIKNGTTMFNDMYFFSKQTALAASKIGIRGVLGEGVLDYPFVCHNKSQEMIDYAVENQIEFSENDLIDFTIAPHAIYTCNKNNLLKSIEAAQKNNMMLHMHVAETEKEVKDSLKNFGKRPVFYLNDIGFFDNKVIIAHGIWVNDEEQDILKEKNISIAITTESHLKLASGFAPIKDYLAKGVNICLGTDGVSSNNNLDMLAEMDFTAKLHKAYNQDPALLPAWEVVKMATINGAKALNKENILGSLEEGKLADIILINRDNLDAVPMYNIYSHLVYTINSSDITDVIINGKVVMEDRKLINVDEKELIEKAKYYQEKIKK